MVFYHKKASRQIYHGHLYHSRNVAFHHVHSHLSGNHGLVLFVSYIACLQCYLLENFHTNHRNNTEVDLSSHNLYEIVAGPAGHNKLIQICMPSPENSLPTALPLVHTE